MNFYCLHLRLFFEQRFLSATALPRPHPALGFACIAVAFVASILSVRIFLETIQSNFMKIECASFSRFPFKIDKIDTLET